MRGTKRKLAEELHEPRDEAQRQRRAAETPEARALRLEEQRRCRCEARNEAQRQPRAAETPEARALRLEEQRRRQECIRAREGSQDTVRRGLLRPWQLGLLGSGLIWRESEMKKLKKRRNIDVKINAYANLKQEDF